MEPWNGPNPEEFISLQKVGYSYDRTNPTVVSASMVNKDIHQAIPKIEKLLKRATKVTYKMTNSTHRDTHLYYYIAPRFSTDYLVIEANVKGESDVLLAINWVPYEPGTRKIDFPNMITKKVRLRSADLVGSYVVFLATTVIREMPHLEKIARREPADIPPPRKGDHTVSYTMQGADHLRPLQVTRPSGWITQTPPSPKLLFASCP